MKNAKSQSSSSINTTVSQILNSNVFEKNIISGNGFNVTTSSDGSNSNGKLLISD